MVKKFVLFVLLQVFVLAFMVASQYTVERYGQEVRLQTAPVDPRDMLYGDYVTLNYDISNIDLSQFDQSPKRGDTVYVVLKKEGQYDQLVSVYLHKPSISSEQSIVKGRVESVNQNPNAQLVHVVYGFERYYVQEGTGKELEDKRGQFDVIIKTTPWGQHLSRISFIANGVMTQREVQDGVYQHYEKQSIPIQILGSRLVGDFEGQDRPVWLVEITTHPNKMNETVGDHLVVVVDAKSGQLLQERKK
jgi:uncharacterized membrane-anchored protein